MAHNFKDFPELSNRQMQIYYFQSPHKQITEDFDAEVVKVHDGDTIRVKADFRKFDFPVRFIDTAAPELDEGGGLKSQKWLAKKILGKDVTVLINPDKRIGKWGRILGRVIHMGIDINQQSIDEGMAIPFEDRNRLWGKFDRELEFEFK